MSALDHTDAPAAIPRRQTIEAWFGEWQPVESLAGRGSAGLWRVADENGRNALLRLYPRFLPADAWKRLVSSSEQRRELRHPRLVSLTDVAPEGLPQVVLEPCPGEPLATLIERELLSPDVALLVLADVIDALDALGDRAGDVDLSPADVFVADGRGRLLADVGILGETTDAGCVDLDHVAPERLTAVRDPNERSIARTVARVATQRVHRRTPASSTYSFASVLFAALTGASPRRADDAEDPGAAPSPPTGLPRKLERVLERALDPHPQRRPQSPRELIELLRGPARPARIAPPRPASAAQEPAAPKIPRHSSATKGSAPAKPATAPEPSTPAEPPRAKAPAAGPSRQAPQPDARAKAADTGKAKGTATPRPAREAKATPAATAAPWHERLGGPWVRAVALAGAAAALAAVAGAAIGAATTEPDPPAPQRLSSDGLRVVAPPAWQEAKPDDVPFEVGAGALAVEAPSLGGSGFVATRSAGPLIATVRGSARDAVSLGPRAAWRYAGVALAGSVADVYLLETVSGPVAAACYAPAGPGAAPPPACARIASTLRVGDAEAVPLGGEASARAELGRALSALGTERAEARDTLAGAGTPRDQAAAADALASAYTGAAATAGELGRVGGPGDHARLVAGLEQAGGAYAALAAAVRAGDASAFDAARESIAAAEDGLRDAIARLSRTAVQPAG